MISWGRRERKSRGMSGEREHKDVRGGLKEDIGL